MTSDDGLRGDEVDQRDAREHGELAPMLKAGPKNRAGEAPALVKEDEPRFAVQPAQGFIFVAVDPALLFIEPAWFDVVAVCPLALLLGVELFIAEPEVAPEAVD